MKQLSRLIAGIDTTVQTSSIRISRFVIQTCTFPSHLPGITVPQILFSPFPLIFLQLAHSLVFPSFNPSGRHTERHQVVKPA